MFTLLVSVTFANAEEGEIDSAKALNYTASFNSSGMGEIGIELCTMDLKSYPQSSKLKRCESLKDCPDLVYGNFAPCEGIDYKGKRRFEHCTVVKVKRYSNYTTCEGSYGFGVRRGRVDAYSENEAVKEAASKGRLSCSPLLVASDIADCKSLEGIAHTKCANNVIGDKFRAYEKCVDNELEQGYNLFGHNCCTVAQKCARSIGGNETTIEDVYKVNYGVGTRFHNIMEKKAYIWDSLEPHTKLIVTSVIFLSSVVFLAIVSIRRARLHVPTTAKFSQQTTRSPSPRTSS
ncbi:MAG: hypothetical protein LBB44_05325 [Endomicrobium sp.]|jgi:hypothetical protein|nr:hypothetical protein [Endomicrobium sp.]